jgi:hypothetical protein
MADKAVERLRKPEDGTMGKWSFLINQGRCLVVSRRGTKPNVGSASASKDAGREDIAKEL